MSPSRTTASGPPRDASGAMWPTIRPCVAPEKRPSVISATSSPRPSPTSAAVTCSISRMPGAAGRALVADHDHVARLDRARLDGGEALLLGVEDARRAAVVEPLVAGELDDAALGRERAAQDREPAGRLERRLATRRRRPGPGVSTTPSPTSASVRPSTPRASPWTTPAPTSSRATRPTPPASYMSVAT